MNTTSNLAWYVGIRIALLLVLALALAVPAGANTLELPVVDPGFENGLNGWTICNGGECNPGNPSDSFVTTSESHTGQASLELVMAAYGGGVWQDIPYSLPAGTAVQLGFWLLMPNAGTQQNKWFVASVGVNGTPYPSACYSWLGATDWSASCPNGAVLSQATSLPTWTYETLSFVLSSPATSIDVLLDTENGDGEGSAEPLWVDDVTLQATEPLSTPEPSTLALLVASCLVTFCLWGRCGCARRPL